MTNDQIAASLEALSAKLDTRFAGIDTSFADLRGDMKTVNARLDQTVTKADVFSSVLQGIGLVAAAVIGTIVVLNAFNMFS